ncbi:MAG: tRNA (N(6)-L-threonylcarbamoyladenosine(37)-C(2))-methylthiotransferase MtaB [Rikenellaceae bacterium]
MNKKVSFHTLGCKLNFSESSTMARQFAENGFERVSSDTEADIYVINTCSVTDSADKKCRNIIRKLSHTNPNAIIAVTGCYAQLKPAEIAAIEGVDIVVGSNNKGELLSYVQQLTAKGKGAIYTCDTDEITTFFSSFSSGDRTRSFLKVQDGCSYKCSYCTIPLARGASRNQPIATIVAEAHEIAFKGIKEIVLTGVNIGDFGKSTGETFLDLIKELDLVEGIERYRISSIEPNLLTPEILEFCNHSSKFQPHYHIPLQSGSDRVLALMRRRYNTKQFSEKIELVKSYDPHVFIGVDVIVGFPGETEQDFEDCYALLARLKPAFLHLFPYSERANTDAIQYKGKVPPAEKTRRMKRMEALCASLHYSFAAQYVGQKVKVLVEGTRKGGKMHGYTENYVKVLLPYRKELIGQIVRAKILSVGENAEAEGTLID